MKDRTILLTEDDFLNRRLLKKVLSTTGYTILESSNVGEALEILGRESVDLVILDINLGEMQLDGISLGQHIRDNYHIPFMYVTAYETPEIMSRAIATTPYSYLTKPFKNADLIASVEIALLSANKTGLNLCLTVKEGEYFVELPVEEIYYIESEGNYLVINTKNKAYRYRSTIKQILEIIPSSKFTQVHRAFVVNKDKIEKNNSKSVVVNKVVIPVSKKQYE